MLRMQKGKDWRKLEKEEIYMVFVWKKK
jgi:hypothetical protein